MPQVLLVRHCESTGQHAEAPLTVRGEAQARALADTLAAHPIDRLVSSPYLRARGTIEPFARRSRLVIEIDERLAERRLSPEPIEDWREVVKRSFVDLDFRAPGGESGRETLSRGHRIGRAGDERADPDARAGAEPRALPWRRVFALHAPTDSGRSNSLRRCPVSPSTAPLDSSPASVWTPACRMA